MPKQYVSIIPNMNMPSNIKGVGGGEKLKTYEVTSEKDAFISRKMRENSTANKATNIPSNENTSFYKNQSVLDSQNAQQSPVDNQPDAEQEKDHLVVFLGGAGMRGDYQYDMVRALMQAGVKRAVCGNYSGLFENGDDLEYNEYIDMGADATSVIFYNQAENDPIAVQMVNTSECKIESKYVLGDTEWVNYSGKNAYGDDCPNSVLVVKLEPRTLDLSLQALNVSAPTPSQGGEFTLIGYSWGGVISARSAMYHANNGIIVDNLVLIGAPINHSLVKAVKSHTNIKNVIIMDLKEQGDPIYAGISDGELIESSWELALQMKREVGHFYYSGNNDKGKERREELAKKLVNLGIK
ncbi:hypothetical protein [Enterovibrio coralii]|uniref:Alpha/beta hydrolase n=1 Tax=Enterovibrio coralii TaxID=294935 RepID=A0A135I379_9GAMM|nr:hypothetical protein [Enterovibrio coralii]KXF79892.1 hypothetical protein ATN88_11550 [Enterovibrio coralii]